MSTALPAEETAGFAIRPDHAQGPVRFAVVGGGWRSNFFLRLTTAMPDRFAATSVFARTETKRERLGVQFGVPVAASVDEAATLGSPEFVLVAVPWPTAPELTTYFAERGVPVLEETPPAPDVDGMRRLWDRVGHSRLVQVADQSMFMPAHTARHAMIAAGVIGVPTSVQVSSNHLYHAVSIMRGLLGVGFGATRVTASKFVAPLVDPLSREGFTLDRAEHERTTTLAAIDFGEGKSGLYDFTENQWFNPLRQRRLVVRGSRGEMVDDRVVTLEDERTVVESRIVRRQTGIDHNLEGFFLDNISFAGGIVYRNPYREASMSDDDIAVAAITDAMGNWVRGSGPEPYSLADGLQDHLIGLAIEESARTGTTVHTAAEAWSKVGRGHGESGR